MTTLKKQKVWLRILAIISVGFGILTIKEGGMVLYGNEAAVNEAGNYVPFVLWFNFIAGFFYIMTGVGLWLQRRWAVGLAIALAVSTALMFAVFGLHIYLGGAYAKRTLIAMTLRTSVWTIIAIIARYQFTVDKNLGVSS